MTTTIDRFNPTFALLPIQNNRTAWLSVYLPTVLVVPYRRSATGIPIDNSDVFDVKFFIEEAPGKAKVAGFEHEGIFVPQYERFVIQIPSQDLPTYWIDVTGQVFVDQDTGAEKEYSQARDGDSFYITLENGEVRDKVTYYKDADYYDLSPISIKTIELKPYGKYNFVWQASYYERVITPDNELQCISNNVKISRLAVLFNHPGDIHRSMVENTPSVYFEGKSFDEDGTVAFYRPFADVLQDIFDEQGFIQGINWVDNIPAQYIPYLAYLLGWDLPYFANSDDDVRRAFIKSARKLQKLKGSKRAIWELFEIFGFSIDVVNLWYRSDGKKFIGPFDRVETEFPNDYVKIETVCTTEPMIFDNNESGFGEAVIPLLYRPTGNITIEAYLVGDTTTTRTELTNLVNQSVLDPASLDRELCSTTPDGMLISDPLSTVDASSATGYSKILIDYKLGEVTTIITAGSMPPLGYAVTYDRDKNQVSIIYDRYLDLSNSRVFVFAVYERDKITPSTTLENLRSNRFDIRVLLYKNGDQPTSDLYDYLLDFLFKIKAFHSLLRKIIFTLELTDVYNVTDYCLGGVNKQKTGSSAGESQVPPAVIPSGESCNPNSRGFKDSDLSYRSAVITGLEEEHRAWKDLDGTHVIPESIRPIIESLSRVAIPTPDAKPCEFTQLGQDRVIADPSLDLDHNADTRRKLCDISGNIDDYCYKGRVNGIMDNSYIISLIESIRCNPCALMMGEGIYWTSEIVSALARWLDKGNYWKSWSDINFVRRAAWNDQLHYTNRSFIDLDSNVDAFLSIRRPSLGIQKDNLMFPGHRFISMGALEYDFSHPVYEYRPWDDMLNPRCPEDALPIPDLNAKIVIGTDGDEWLVFDKIQLKYFGNGLHPDVSSLGSHISGTDIQDADVTHAIYTTMGPLGSVDPVESDTLTPTEDESICTTDPIFQSANRNCTCGSDSGAGGVSDYIDGYPSISGRYEYDQSLGFIDGDTSRYEWAELLGIEESSSNLPDDLLFKVGSGIRTDDPNYKAYRMDCGCSMFQCGSVEASNPAPIIDRCHISNYLDPDGSLDFNCDKVEMMLSMILQENVSTCSYILDGTIPSMILVDESKTQIDRSGPLPIISVRFKDGWDTIHSIVFIVSGDKIDITWTSMNPVVWGEPPTGYTEGRRVFRKGIITTQHQLLQASNGATIITDEWSTQKVGYFQSNVACGDRQLTDPFIYHVDCAVTDQVEFDILCGPGWADPSFAGGSAWAEVVEDTFGHITLVPSGGEFFWIDAWGNGEGGEITGTCV